MNPYWTLTAAHCIFNGRFGALHESLRNQRGYMPRNLLRILGMALVAMAATSVSARPVVLELFTSQGCSSCPPADALLASMNDDANVIPLSLHVDYWDYLGWKDPFSSTAMTARQRSYSSLQGKNNVFTPQLMVDGKYSTVGSNASDVRDAIKQAQAGALFLPITLTANAATQRLAVHIARSTDTALPKQGTIYAFYYTRQALTSVARGENSGRTLTNINNVSHIEKLGNWQAGSDFDHETALPVSPQEGVAIIAQADGQGPVIGAARYVAH